MKEKLLFKKALAYVCVATLALSTVAGTNLYQIKADEDVIVLDGDTSGASSLVGTYSNTTDDYKYLGFVTTKDAGSDYKYLEMTYTGNITELRFEFEGAGGNSPAKWFNPAQAEKFVTADTSEISMTGDNTTILIDLEASGIDLGNYATGIHMHCANLLTNGDISISSAKLLTGIPSGDDETTETVPTDTSSIETSTEAETSKVIADGTNDIILNGDDLGRSAMIGTYKVSKGTVEAPTYKYLGWATFKDFANETYKYLKITYTGNIQFLRFEFEQKGGDKYGPVWFDAEQEMHFVTEDGNAIPMIGNNTTIVIDLAKSGVDMSKFNSGVHMHCSAEAEDVNFSISNAVLYGGVKSEPAPTTAPTTASPTTTTTKAPTVKVGKTAIRKATKKKSAKKAKIVLKKVTGVAGYQIKISTNKKFAKKLTRTINTKKATVVIKKLKANKKYYVKARAYKIVNKAKKFGKWTTKKPVKNL